MNILFFGSTEFSVPFLEEIYNSKHVISAVITTPDKRRGRGKKLLPNPVKKSSIDLGINFIQVEKLDNEFIDKVKKISFDCIVVVSFGLILPKNLLDLVPNRCINIHPSLLPRYRGPSPVTSVLLNGEEKTGISIINMVEEVDAGDIYVQAEFGVDKNDNKDILERKLIEFGKPLVIAVLNLLEEVDLKTTAQDESCVTYTSLIGKRDLKIDWDKSAVEIVNRIRAFSYKPGCFSFFKNKRIKILKASIYEDDRKERFLAAGEDKNGSILAADKDVGLLVRCNENEIVSIQLLKPQGKNLMKAVDFINGYRIKTGEKFE